MENLIEMLDDTDYTPLAVEKINTELAQFHGDKYGEIVKTYVANTLREFCEKSEAFAKVVYKTKRSLSDCIKAAMKGCGTGISDIQVYRRVAKFYFPDSEVAFEMKITVGDAPDEAYINKEPAKQQAKETEDDTAKKKPEVPEKVKEPKQENVIQLSLF